MAWKCWDETLEQVGEWPLVEVMGMCGRLLLTDWVVSGEWLVSEASGREDCNLPDRKLHVPGLSSA
jgi:hypothetical protein